MRAPARRCLTRTCRRLAALALLGGVIAVPAQGGERVVVDLPLPPPGTTRPAGALPPPTGLMAASVALNAPGDTLPPAAPGVTGASEPDRRHVVLEIPPGQSLYNLFSRHGLSQADLVTMVRSHRRIKWHLRRLQAGQRIAIEAAADGTVHRLRVVLPGPDDLLVERGHDARFGWRRVPDAPLETLTTAHAWSPEPASEAAQEQVPHTPPIGAEAPHREETPATPDDSQPAEEAVPASEHRLTVAPGDSLYLIFRRLGVPATDLANLLEADKKARVLRRLRPGQDLSVGLSAEGVLDSLTLELDETRTFRARRAGNAFTIEVDHEPLERRVATASAVIEDALFLAGQREGLSDRVIMELVEIFGWDVDFALDVRAGDHFSVIYEELFKDGRKVRDGHILAAEFVNRGRAVRALRYVDATGRAAYFSPEGLSMRKAFLRTPVNFSRISSRFTSGRMHPVLQRMRAHRGVDYAAPTGTPVRAAGDGRVAFAGWKGGYGKAVILQHGATYTTLYGHLSRIHPRVRGGARLEQGDIIGYVGQTGLASGPHLHYEFRVRGVHQDPLRVKLPKALPIEARYKSDFLSKSRPLVARLDALSRTSVASSD